MWPNLINKAKEGGLDTIETYVFWNMHEPVKGQRSAESHLELHHIDRKRGLPSCLQSSNVSCETVAVKVLAVHSKQGENEFLNEVTLLGRLHDSNLMNLVGYCAETGQRILIFVYMSRVSLAAHLYDEIDEPLTRDSQQHSYSQPGN